VVEQLKRPAYYPWYYTILKRLALNLLRSKKSHPESSLSQAQESLLTDSNVEHSFDIEEVSTRCSPENLRIREQTRQQVRWTFAELALWVQSDPVLLREFEQMKALKILTAQHRPDDLPPEKWDQYWQGVYPRLERGLGWMLMSLGALVLLIYGSWEIAKEWILSPDIPLWIKAAGISFWTGLAILLISVIREKLFLHKQERYKDIQR